MAKAKTAATATATAAWPFPTPAGGTTAATETTTTAAEGQSGRSDEEILAESKANQAKAAEAKAAEKKAAQEKKEADKAAKAKEKEEKAAAKKAEAEQKKAEREATKEQRAAASAERKARLEAMAGEGRKGGSMLALADRVKQGAYVKGANGQLRSTDELAVALDGVGPTDVVRIGLDLLKLEENPYANLNIGQQSMNLRNRMRGAIKKSTLTIAEIGDYITRNSIHRVTAEAVAAAKAEREAKAAAAKAEREAKAEAARKEKAEKAPATEAATDSPVEGEQAAA